MKKVEATKGKNENMTVSNSLFSGRSIERAAKIEPRRTLTVHKPTVLIFALYPALEIIFAQFL